ncbi:MAG: hydroxymethylglutaryl-CoA lyase [Bacteroidetes bacterium]|nr:hydroxymethylglutaryl-CoA lyase [Bacteroidota bacterium]MBU1373835.1 hydroxymethylglutaryl-CoA lyase [Bacteroidota bacterium]MBU1483941.1 hydroxymethylglutaryl-CoA lyase [Bacteroidota bacterium]MBU1761806.1 hydroxymethylglutaryl-CoA lyase [Bacteroidota bacterium]MBU2268472.1 hydroxymethylglutaryl-CoA lyase [Bacteroidota bacterium]
MPNSIKLIECPRDAMQGIHEFIPTDLKAQYINLLLKVGFDTIDFGSFVSTKAIPQMKDTTELVKKLDLSDTQTKLLAIIANTRGAEDACQFEEINYLGFPFSISETFQQRNTNSSIEESLTRVEEIQNLCVKHGKKAVVYLSMGFGNPYGDPWNLEILSQWTERLIELDVEILSLADTIGVSSPQKIKEIYPYLTQKYTSVEWGMHLHSTPIESHSKIEAAFESGCTRFDSALKGYGGCPMAADELTGNIATEKVLAYLSSQDKLRDFDLKAWEEAMLISTEIFH